MFKRIKKAVVAGVAVVGVALPVLAEETYTAPIDLAAAGTSLAGYIAVAAGCALAIFVGLYAIRVIIRSFKAVK